jgi:Family of unknown function (DUF6925)
MMSSVPGASNIVAFLAAQIADHETQWSLGTFGAIAEFARDEVELVDLQSHARSLWAITSRGGIRIEARPDVRLVAFETTSKESWNHRIALCLPEDACIMNRRPVLTELGPDSGALRECDRDAVLFDLGIEAMQADVCVRVGDPNVAAQLRSHCGQPVLAAGNPAMGVILASSPHRVFISRLGRIEVYQPIPPHDGKSPEGPHTHVLPNLLRHRRTHAATEQIPEGFVPCAHLYPAHPAKDRQGQVRPFDRARFDAFQDILGLFGDPNHLAIKRRVFAAVAAGQDPSVVSVTNSRFARTNVRVALRQIKAVDEVRPAALATWLAAHEPAGAEVD